MANPRRILRLQELILRTIANTVQRELRDPRVGMVAVTRVKLSTDLGRAQIYWSCMGDESERRTMERGLDDALPLIQRAVAKDMQTRVTPKLTLRYDVGIEKQQRMEDIFRTIRDERGEPVAGEDAESGEDDAAAGDAESGEDDAATGDAESGEDDADRK